jgi:adenine deaminase
VYKVLQAACINPVIHYNMNNGLLKEGDAADFVVVQDLQKFQVLETYINGRRVAHNGCSLIDHQPNAELPLNNFNCAPIATSLLEVAHKGAEQIPVIEAYDGQLITGKLLHPPKLVNGKIVSDVENDVLKMIVVNRYHPAPIAIAFIKNFQLKEGAIASTVAHDSHNIVAVGVDDHSICKAVNLVIASKGGVSCVSAKEEQILPLPVAGLMSTNNGFEVARAYTKIDQQVKKNGSTLSAPFMTLSFMALLVIPHLKLSDKGLFDGDAFQLIQ